MAKDPAPADGPLAISGGKLAGGLRLAGARYLLKRTLGRGSLSEVWLAWDRTLEQDVALKFLPQLVLEDPKLIESLREATLRSQKLIHPAIARVYDFVQDHQTAAITSEYVDGWSLATMKVDRPQKRFRLEEIRLWIWQLCAALEFAHHELGLVHRSLKLSNLLLNAREQFKVTDFEIAHLLRSALAQPGSPAFGSAACMSPQQLKGAEASLLDDVYSLGALIFELLTGTPPFHKRETQGLADRNVGVPAGTPTFSKADLLLQARDLPPPSMAERLLELGIDDSFPFVWEQTVADCLAKDPAR